MFIVIDCVTARVMALLLFVHSVHTATSTSTVNSAALLNTYKSAMIVLAVIAGVAIAIAVLLTVYIVKKIHTKGLYHCTIN